MDARDYVRERALDGAGFEKSGFRKETDLPEGAVDEDDEDTGPMDIEHEQIYYLLADAYPEHFDGPEHAREVIHEELGITEGEEKDEDPCWDGYEQRGMKDNPDGEGEVPNCVPVDE